MTVLAPALVLFVLTQSPPPAPGPDEASTITAEDRRHLETLRAAIKGKEQKPSREVFKNVKLLGDVPAGRLLGVMEIGYARSLGESCSFCHVPGEWDSDKSDHKVIARQMIVMMRAINQEYLAKIPELAEDKPAVNCTTCHRGQKKPALELPTATK